MTPCMNVILLVIYLWLFGVLTLWFLSQGLSANQNWHILWLAFFFFFLIECFTFVLFFLSSFVFCGLITSLHEFPFERACKSYMSLKVLFEVAANWGYMLCYIEINRPCYFLTFSLAKLYIIWAKTIGNTLSAW